MRLLKIYRLLTGFMLFLLILQPTKAQQDPIYTQYMFNTLALNPAYAGTRGMLSTMLLSRHQWVGFDGAPSTQTFSIHSPVSHLNFGAGLTLIHDRIGPVKNSAAWVDYAYRLQLSETINLSMALRGGMTHYQVDYTEFLLEIGSDDPAYNTAATNDWLPNFGFGTFMYSDRFYAGISIPRLFENKFADSGDVQTEDSGSEQRLFLVMGGLVFDLSPGLKLKPSFLARFTQAAPLSIDLSATFLIKETLWIGGMVRPGDALGAISHIQITPQLRFGYAFDMNTNELRSFHSGTHELMINYEFNFKKEKIKSPRYF
jgi:type IX secretion system PorP/SprF family membrane protein